MIPNLVRTPAELREAREALGLSADQLAVMVRMGDGRTVRRWEAGENEIPGPVVVILETAMDFLRQKEEIKRSLEMLESGESQLPSWGPTYNPETAGHIERSKAAITGLEQALATLTRQAPAEQNPVNNVHWFELRRLTPKFDPNGKDSWSLPGETSVAAALAYFKKAAKFSHELTVCENDLAAEFALDEFHSFRIQVGASWRVRRGDFIETHFVKLKAG
jgi:transcriptional regulator with XRE-family HTH domain